MQRDDSGSLVKNKNGDDEYAEIEDVGMSGDENERGQEHEDTEDLHSDVRGGKSSEIAESAANEVKDDTLRQSTSLNGTRTRMKSPGISRFRSASVIETNPFSQRQTRRGKALLSNHTVILPHRIFEKIADPWTSLARRDQFKQHTGPFHLLSLSPEIRQMIYRHVMCSHDVIWPSLTYRGHRIPLPRDLVLSLLRTNKLIRTEALLVFFKNKTVQLGGVHEVWKWLDKIGPVARSCITTVHCTLAKRKYAARAFQMLADCGSLKILHVRIGELDVVNIRARGLSSPVGGLSKQKRLLSEVEGIRELFAIRNLEECEVEVWPQHLHVKESERETFRKLLREVMKPGFEDELKHGAI